MSYQPANNSAVSYIITTTELQNEHAYTNTCMSYISDSFHKLPLFHVHASLCRATSANRWAKSESSGVELRNLRDATPMAGDTWTPTRLHRRLFVWLKFVEVTSDLNVRGYKSF